MNFKTPKIFNLFFLQFFLEFFINFLQHILLELNFPLFIEKIIIRIFLPSQKIYEDIKMIK